MEVPYANMIEVTKTSHGQVGRVRDALPDWATRTPDGCSKTSAVFSRCWIRSFSRATQRVFEGMEFGRKLWFEKVAGGIISGCCVEGGGQNYR